MVFELPCPLPEPEQEAKRNVPAHKSTSQCIKGRRCGCENFFIDLKMPVTVKKVKESGRIMPLVSVRSVLDIG
jgi:hypothetical protein